MLCHLYWFWLNWRSQVLEIHVSGREGFPNVILIRMSWFIHLQGQNNFVKVKVSSRLSCLFFLPHQNLTIQDNTKSFLTSPQSDNLCFPFSITLCQLSIFLSFCLCLSAWPPTSLPVYLPACLSVCLSACLPACLSVNKLNFCMQLGTVIAKKW